MIEPKLFLDYLHELYPEVKATLEFSNDFECLVAILLSAQTTDVSVNKVTPVLFKHFPTPEEMAKANIEDIENDIKSLGLYRAKAKHLKELSLKLQGISDNTIDLSFEELRALPGVGWKTATVFLLERKGIASIPVDTHIKRISGRLGYSKPNDEPEVVSKKLMKHFPKGEWQYLHHAIILFGRNVCSAKNPLCGDCKFRDECPYLRKCSKTIGKKS